MDDEHARGWLLGDGNRLSDIFHLLRLLPLLYLPSLTLVPRRLDDLDLENLLDRLGPLWRLLNLVLIGQVFRVLFAL